jgi:hypothetical protein
VLIEGKKYVMKLHGIDIRELKGENDEVRYQINSTLTGILMQRFPIKGTYNVTSNITQSIVSATFRKKTLQHPVFFEVIPAFSFAYKFTLTLHCTAIITKFNRI